MYVTPEKYRVGVVCWYSILTVRNMGGAVCTESEYMISIFLAPYYENKPAYGIWGAVCTEDECKEMDRY